MFRKSIKSHATFYFGTIVIVGGFLVYYFVVNIVPGLIATDNNESKIANPSGYVYLTSFMSDDRRPLPLVYDISRNEFISLPNEESLFYQQFYPHDKNSATKVFAPYIKRTTEDMRFTHSEFLRIDTNNLILEPKVFLAGGVQKSPSNNLIAFHGISSTFAKTRDAVDIFNPINRNQIQNWSIYVADLKTKEIIEIEEGVSPVWSQDSNSLYYLSTQGIVHYDMLYGIATRISGFAVPRTFYTSSSRLAISSDENFLYSNFLSATGKNDALFIHQITNTNSKNTALVRQYDLPDGTYTAMTISPDNAFAGFIVYNHERGGSFTFRVLNLQNDQVEIEDMFTLDTYDHNILPYPVWTTISPY